MNINIEDISIEDLSLTCHDKAHQFLMESMVMRTKPDKFKEYCHLSGEALRCSVACWVLNNATHEQCLKLWDSVCPPRDRN